jgi:hypothetical protein
MTTAADFEAAQTRKVSVPCKVCVFLARRRDRAVYDVEFAKPVTVRSNVAILTVLQDNGADVSEGGVKRHRSKHVR